MNEPASIGSCRSSPLLGRWIRAIAMAMLIDTAWFLIWLLVFGDLMLCSTDTPGAGGFRFAPPCPPEPSLSDRFADASIALLGITASGAISVWLYGLEVHGKRWLLVVPIFGLVVPIVAFLGSVVLAVGWVVMGWLITR